MKNSHTTRRRPSPTLWALISVAIVVLVGGGCALLIMPGVLAPRTRREDGRDPTAQPTSLPSPVAFIASPTAEPTSLTTADQEQSGTWPTPTSTRSPIPTPSSVSVPPPTPSPASTPSRTPSPIPSPSPSASSTPPPSATDTPLPTGTPSPSAEPSVAVEAFELGILGPFSGPNAPTGDEFRGSATMAFEGIMMEEYAVSPETAPDPVVGGGAYTFPVLQYFDGEGVVVYPPEWADQELIPPGQ